MRIRPRTARAEKAMRLVAASLVSLPVGILAVVLDSPALGYTVVGVLLAAIVAGPAMARRLLGAD